MGTKIIFVSNLKLVTMKKIYYAISLLLIPAFLMAAAPTEPSSNLTTGNIEGNSMYIYFTKGNGSARIAIVKAGSPVTARPQNGNSYLANNTFGSGQEIAPGEFVVYNGGGSSFGINNLVPNTEYFIAIFEVNGAGISAEFLTTSFLSANVFTLSKPTVQPGNFSVSEITGNAMKISWEAGDGKNRIVLARRGGPVNANPVELTSYRAYSRVEYRGSNSGSVIGDNNFVVYKGTGTSVSLSEMYPDTTYHFAIFEYNGNSGPVYLTTNPLRASAKTLPQPTNPSSDIIVSQVEANQFSLRWTPGNGTYRMVVVSEDAPVTSLPQKNVSYGSNPYFDKAPEIAPGHKVVYNSSGNNCTVYNLSLGTTYYIAIFEYSGSGTNVGYLTNAYATTSQATKSIPGINVTNIGTSYLAAYNAQLSFTPGNGTGRLIVMRKDSAVNFIPENFKAYNWNATYGSTYGKLGNENFAVYKGSDSAALVSLQPNTKYYVAAFEYNGTNYPAYNITNVDTFSFTTKLPAAPTEPSQKLGFSSIEGNSFRLMWTRGDGERRIVIVRKGSTVTAIPVNGVQYTSANKAFNLAPEIEPGQKVVYDGTGYYADIDSLEIGTTYHVQVIEYNGTGSITSYLTDKVLKGDQSTVSAPAVSASEVHFKLLTLDKLRILWRMGNGSRRIVLARKNAPVDGVPENLKTYNASSYYGGGAKIGESFVVYSYGISGTFGDQTTDTIYTEINSIEPGNTYYFKIFEYNGVLAPVYKQADPGEGSFKITFEPPTPTTDFRSTSSDGNTLALHWTRGGGDKRIIIAREGQPVDVVPQDGIDYAENKNFRLAAEVVPGQKVIYDGSGYFTNPEGLNPSTEYFFKIFEYGGTGADIDYLTSVHDSTSASTQFPPTITASNVVISGITPESGNVSWTNGDGGRRIVIAKKGSSVSAEPKDTTTYNSNYFGRGSHLGEGNFVVYKGDDNHFPMQQLQGGTTYHLSVYEFNGNAGPVILRPGATAKFTTLGPPQENAIVDSTTEITDNSFHIHFTLGSGQRRIIVVREGSAVSSEPVDNKKYIDNTFLGAGDELGDGNFVVYDGIEDNVIITGLQPATTYYFTIFEYNAFSGGSILSYLRPSTGSGVITTLGSLPVKWASFDGMLDKDVVRLRWATGFEQNNSQFKIERSLDGITFHSIGTVSSKGNTVSGHSYTYNDLLPENILLRGGLLFYRIRQEDIDGKYATSEIITIYVRAGEASYLAYPNPVTKGMLPGINIGDATNVLVEIYNSEGKRMLTQRLAKGYNTLNMKNAASGWYVIRLLFSDGSTRSVKIFVE